MFFVSNTVTQHEMQQCGQNTRERGLVLYTFDFVGSSKLWPTSPVSL
jgi:hypothetical protein